MDWEGRWGAIITAIVAAAGPLGIWLFRVWDRKDSREDKKREWRNRQETSLFDRQDKQLERAYIRIAELEKDVEDLSEGRTRALDIAIRWYTRAARYHLTLLTMAVKQSDVVILPLPEFEEKDLLNAAYFDGRSHLTDPDPLNHGRGNSLGGKGLGPPGSGNKEGEK